MGDVIAVVAFVVSVNLLAYLGLGALLMWRWERGWRPPTKDKDDDDTL